MFKLKPKIYRFSNGAVLIYKRRKICEATAINAGFWAGHNYIEKINGLPHFVEHVLFKGTHKRTENQILEDETKITSLNALTSAYVLCVNFFESNKKIEECFEFASDVLLNTNLTEELIESEKKVVFEERERAKDKVEKDILAQQFRFVEKDFILNEDYRFGTEETLGKATVNDIYAFISKHFVSDKFFISAASSLPFKSIKKLAKKYFVNNLNKPETKSNILPYKKFNLNGKEGINIVKNEENTIKGLVSIKFTVENGELYKRDYNIACLIANINSRSDTFYNMARKLGLIYAGGAYVNYNSFSNSMTIDFEFTTSKLENVDTLINLIGDTIAILKTEGVSLEQIADHTEKAILNLDKSFPSKYGATADHLTNEFYRYNKIETISKKKKIKLLKAVNQETINKEIENIFNKKNKVYITFMGNVEVSDFKTLKEYKTMIFKK